MSSATSLTEFNQVVFGDRGSGQTDLLASSGPYDDRLFTVADLPETPPPEYAPPPHYSVRRFGNLLAFAKTALDPEQRRKGMTRTHVLTIAAGSVLGVRSIGPILRALDPFAKIESVTSGPLSLDLTDESPGANAPGGDALLAATVMRYHRTGDPIVWVGLDSFPDALCYVWALLPPKMRGALSVRLGMQAQNIYDADRRSDTTRIVVVPRQMAGSWHSDSVTGPDTPPPESGPVLTYLQTEGGPLERLLSSLGLRFGDSDAFQLLNQASELYARLDSKDGSVGMNELLQLGEFGDRLVPSLSKDSEFRRHVSTALVTAAEADGGERIRNLRNFDAGAYPDGEQILDIMADAWALRALIQAPRDGDAEVARLASNSQSAAWNRAMQGALSTHLSDPRSAPAVTTWFSEHADLVSSIGALVPKTKRLEDAYVSATDSDGLAVPLVEWALTRRWAVLCARCLHLVEGADLAVTRVSQMEGGRVDEALRSVLPHAADEAVVQAAVETEQLVLMREAAQRCAKQPELLLDLDLSRPSAQQVWLDSIEVRGAMSSVGVDILGPLLNDTATGSVAADVLGELVDRAGLTLFDDDRFEGAISRLPKSAFDRVMARTADVWVNKFKAWVTGDGSPFPESDPRVAKAVAKNHTVRDVVPVTSSLVALVRLFESVPEYEQDSFVGALKALYPANRDLHSDDALRLGRFVLKRRWKSAAKNLRETAGYQRGYKIAYEQTTRLFDPLDRAMGFFSLLGSGSESLLDPGDWWKAFHELCIQNYPEGVKQRSVIEEAGGDLADMQLGSVSGKEQWRHVVRGLKKGQFSFDVHDLLETMAVQLPGNTDVPRMLNLYTDYVA